VHGWEGKRNELPQASIDSCRQCTQLALDAGINHIETAYGYGKSEHLYGKVLNEELSVPRGRYHLMTKGRPWTREETYELVDRQLSALRTDHIDLYGWHGMNSAEDCDKACARGGPVEALHDLKRQRVIGHVGFSTHAPLPVILRADRDRPLRVLERTLLLLSSAQRAGGAARCRERHGCVHHLAQRQGRASVQALEAA
jgi:predicted aldo/keto reductase-like oxidoreductase